jgi:hypothetical protein
MRTPFWTLLFALSVVPLALAQGPLPTTSGMGFTGAPYSAKETTTVEKRTISGDLYTPPMSRCSGAMPRAGRARSTSRPRPPALKSIPS